MGGGLLAGCWTGSVYLGLDSSASASVALRPHGALDERRFVSARIRCGDRIDGRHRAAMGLPFTRLPENRDTEVRRAMSLTIGGGWVNGVGGGGSRGMMRYSLPAREVRTGASS